MFVLYVFCCTINSDLSALADFPRVPPHGEPVSCTNLYMSVLICYRCGPLHLFLLSFSSLFLSSGNESGSSEGSKIFALVRRLISSPNGSRAAARNGSSGTGEERVRRWVQLSNRAESRQITKLWKCLRELLCTGDTIRNENSELLRTEVIISMSESFLVQVW